jgi:hypothetical protein
MMTLTPSKDSAPMKKLVVQRRTERKPSENA